MIDLPVSPMLAKMEDEFGTNSSKFCWVIVIVLEQQN